MRYGPAGSSGRGFPCAISSLSPRQGATLPWRFGRVSLPGVWEASHSEGANANAAAIWSLWRNPARWPDWNEQLKSAELDGDFEVGSKATIHFKRGGKMVFDLVAVEDERVFIDEAKLLGARFGHEHRIEPRGRGVEITHRLYFSGPLATPFSFLFGRRRMRKSVIAFIKSERELTE